LNKHESDRIHEIQQGIQGRVIQISLFLVEAVLIIAGIVLDQLEIISLNAGIILIVISLFFIFGIKQRIPGRPEERHFKNK